jgi:hypothetical protein
MKKIIVLLTLFVATTSFAFTLSFDPVTQYTDNTLIGAEALGVFYNIEMDGTRAVTKTAATSWALPAVPKKSAHTFRVQTEVGTGEVSVWSPPFAWTSPAGNPGAPGQLRVAPSP